MSRHNNTGPRMRRILTPPQTRHRLLLRVKLQAGLAIKRARAAASNALLVPGKREHGQRHGNGHVDAQLPGFDVLLEPRRRGPRGGEDGGAVAVLVGVGERDGVVERVGVEADEYGAEDFLLVAGHVGRDVGDDCGGDLYN
jgi:hypothetical protein